MYKITVYRTGQARGGRNLQERYRKFREDERRLGFLPPFMSKGVGKDCEIDGKGLSKIRRTGICEALPPNFYIVFFFNESFYYFKGAVTVLYIQKVS